MSLVDFTPYRSLKERDLAREGLFVAEGRFLVERALASSWEIFPSLSSFPGGGVSPAYRAPPVGASLSLGSSSKGGAAGNRRVPLS